MGRQIHGNSLSNLFREASQLFTSPCSASFLEKSLNLIPRFALPFDCRRIENDLDKPPPRFSFLQQFPLLTRIPLDDSPTTHTFYHMKFCAPIVLLISLWLPCLGENQVVSSSEISWREGIIYHYGSERLFTGTVQTFWDEGVEKKEYRVTNGLRDGLWIEWYPNGQKLKEVHWKEGKRVNHSTWWYQDGQKWKKIYFNEMGKYLVSEFYEGGAKLKAVSWKDDKMNGPYKVYYENGHVLREVNYLDGKKNGTVTWWHKNGVKWKEYSLDSGKINGMYTHWRQDGGIWKQEGWKQDVLEGRNTIWQSNGNKMKEVFYVDGKLSGPLTTWWLNGVIQEKGFYENGDKTNTFMGYHENGRKAYEALFKDGKRLSFQTWSANGENTSTPVEVPEKEDDQ